MSLDCSPDLILLFVLIKYAKTSYFVPVDYIGFVGILVEKPWGNPHEKYTGVPKAGVIKDVLYKVGDKDHVHLFISVI